MRIALPDLRGKAGAGKDDVGVWECMFQCFYKWGGMDHRAQRGLILRKEEVMRWRHVFSLAVGSFCRAHRQRFKPCLLLFRRLSPQALTFAPSRFPLPLQQRQPVAYATQRARFTWERLTLQL